MESFAPAVGPETGILPLLNGMRHLDLLSARFGANHVLGGLCMISAALDPAGAIRHFTDMTSLAFGEPDGSTSSRVRSTPNDFSTAGVYHPPSVTTLQTQW